MAAHEGYCSCGAVHYALTAEPMFVNCCHCRSCQQELGTAYAISALIEPQHVVHHQGELAEIALPTHGGRTRTIKRCKGCGSPVWSFYSGMAPVHFIRVGTLASESRDRLVPQAHIFARSKLPWVVLPADVPAFDAFYDLPKLWPPESLTRLRACMASARDHQRLGL